MAHTELGRKILDRLVEDLKELATVDSYPKLDGRNMVMVIAPIKKPQQDQQKQQRSRSRDDGPPSEDAPAAPVPAPASGESADRAAPAESAPEPAAQAGATPEPEAPEGDQPEPEEAPATSTGS
jgi:translation initiation factor IF-3